MKAIYMRKFQLKELDKASIISLYQAGFSYGEIAQDSQWQKQLAMMYSAV